MNNNAFDKKAAELLRSTLRTVLYFALKRQPTEEEMFEELMCMKDGKIKTKGEAIADAFDSKHYTPGWPERSVMIDLGYWKDDRNE